MPCYRQSTNAPIICSDVAQVMALAKKSHAQVVLAEDDVGLLNIVVDSTKSGRWVCMLASSITTAMLREVVYQVWLKGSWNHHPDFRAWIVDPTFTPPPKEELLYGFGAPRIEPTAPKHGIDDPELLQRLEKDAPNDGDKGLPYLLVRSAVYLQYTEDFESEFKARDLITAVADSELFRTEEVREHVALLKPQDLVDLFRLASREDVMCALAARGEVDDADRVVIISSRDREGRSPLDIAIEKDFKTCAVLLRNLGCKSETFKFERLLDPNFQPMLRVLLDPWKQFPFDPVLSLRKVALGGQGPILRRLFECRVDVGFDYWQYPLSEACESGCDDVAWIVLDRMGVTGVSPLHDARCAALHLVRTLMFSFENPGFKAARKTRASTEDQGEALLQKVVDPNAPQRSATKSMANVEPLSDTGHWVLDRLATVCIAEGKRFGIPLPALCRGEKYADLMPKLLQLVDVTKEENTEGLLEFFIYFDPTNELAKQITKKALTDVGNSGGKDVDEVVYKLVWKMIQQGEKAVSMTHWAIELVAFRQYFPFTFRGHNGETILMKALGKPPNVGALESILTTMPRGSKEIGMEQPDASGNNALKRMVVLLCQDPDAYGPYMEQYGDAVRLLLQHGMSYRVEEPAFTTDLFTMAARQELGDVCFELFHTRTRQGSIILSCSPNTLALMWRRLRRLQKEPIAPRTFVSVFEEGEVKWRNKSTKDQSTATEDESYVTNIVDVNKRASAILTEEEKKPWERFVAQVPQAKVPPVTELDKRVSAARVPHPTFGANILTLLDLEVISHICSFVRLKDLKQVSLVSTSFFYASLFDNVWVERQVSELFSKTKKQLTTLRKHAAVIAAAAGDPTENAEAMMEAPPIDFMHASHPLESARSIFIMHVMDQLNKQC